MHDFEQITVIILMLFFDLFLLYVKVNPLKKKISKKEQVLQIYKIIHEMEEPYKEVFWMRTFSNLSFKDISLFFGKTESWARVTYYRAKCKIKEVLK